jgi:hypothetical protein
LKLVLDEERFSHFSMKFWPSSFREEDFLEINQPETRIAYGSHVC